MHTGACTHGVHVEVGGKLCGIGSLLLLLYRFWEWKLRLPGLHSSDLHLVRHPAHTLLWIVLSKYLRWCLIFEELWNCVLKRLHCLNIATNKYEGSTLSASPLTCYCFLDTSMPVAVKWCLLMVLVAQADLELVTILPQPPHTVYVSPYRDIPSYLDSYWAFYLFLGEMSIQIYRPFNIRLFGLERWLSG